ncbi:MAG: AtpZ/AtpI family protein [bacterium]
MNRKRWDARKGKQYRDIGIYTVIPTMMIVGPLLGYYLGSLAEKKWGHSPWPSAGGAIFGLAAAVRQIWLILQRHGSQK